MTRTAPAARRDGFRAAHNVDTTPTRKPGAKGSAHQTKKTRPKKCALEHAGKESSEEFTGRMNRIVPAVHFSFTLCYFCFLLFQMALRQPIPRRPLVPPLVPEALEVLLQEPARVEPQAGERAIAEMMDEHILRHRQPIPLLPRPDAQVIVLEKPDAETLVEIAADGRQHVPSYQWVKKRLPYGNWKNTQLRTADGPLKERFFASTRGQLLSPRTSLSRWGNHLLARLVHQGSDPTLPYQALVIRESAMLFLRVRPLGTIGVLGS
jgi:hypothetical protein